MGCAKVVFFTVVLSLAWARGAEETWIRAAPPCDFPAMYNFGDSNSDTGGASATFGPIPPPYGESFFRRPAGRASDGRLIIDFIAEHLGLPHLSSYPDSIGANYRHGANFASGGSTIRRQNESIFENGLSPFSLDIQIAHFDQFKERTSELYCQDKDPYEMNKLPRPREFSRALYTFDIGQNDLAAGFGKLSAVQLKAAIPDIVNQFAMAVTHLYQRGARTFWIHNTGPIGCLPGATFYIQNPKPGFLDKYGCIKAQNNMAIEFNRQLKTQVTKLRRELPRAALIYVDIYSAKYHLIRKAEYYGFMDPSKICCGHHEKNINVWCGQRLIINNTEIFGGSCSSPSTYISWDGVHYSQAANHWIVNNILNGSFSDPPKVIDHACLKHKM
ncbi:GDSL esterase/lipase At5g14450-like [Olea europaea var. sylvestris]|uniref:GDSL esterase/lipase At5g14450-like n=1 Tax=Olea europaea var. sylvestris TaxID=158386 RepID=UPI000C1CCE27|nr:GDSL esterase/lipase At5g14450-like [Olea europaea var. sylvestris]